MIATSMIDVLSRAGDAQTPLPPEHLGGCAAVRKIFDCAGAMQKMHALSLCFFANDRRFVGISHRNAEGVISSRGFARARFTMEL